MKKCLLLLIFTSMFSCMPKELPTVASASPGYVLLKVSHQTTKDELDAFSQEVLNTQGVTIDYSKSEFFDDGKMRKLRLMVKCPYGTVGTTSADLTVLQFKYYGFIYQMDGNPKLKIGVM